MKAAEVAVDPGVAHACRNLILAVQQEFLRVVDPCEG